MQQSENMRKRLQEHIESLEFSHLRTFAVMPLAISVFNGQSSRCDMLIGPCGCGAWHKLSDWVVADVA